MIRFVLAQRTIGSQIIDNLNASIHIRALLTDIFLLDEAFEKRRLRLNAGPRNRGSRPPEWLADLPVRLITRRTDVAQTAVAEGRKFVAATCRRATPLAKRGSFGTIGGGAPHRRVARDIGYRIGVARCS